MLDFRLVSAVNGVRVLDTSSCEVNLEALVSMFHSDFVYNAIIAFIRYS